MSAYRMHRSLRVARHPPSRYNPARCGQAGQLVRGLHAPPAAATFRMGTARHGAREMNDERGSPGELPLDDSVEKYCGEASVVLGDYIAELEGRGIAPRLALNRAKYRLLFMYLRKGWLIARALRYGASDLEYRDIPVDFWPYEPRRLIVRQVGADLCFNFGGTWWFALLVRPAKQFTAGPAGAAVSSAEPAQASPKTNDPIQSDKVADLAVPDAAKAARSLQQQQYREHAQAIWQEVIGTGRAYSGVVHEWIAAGKHKEIVKSGGAGFVGPDAYKKTIDRETERLGRPVKKKAEGRGQTN